MAWEGERTVTFTMEDALISPAGFMILSGAGLIDASEGDTIKVHTTEQTDEVTVTTEKITGDDGEENVTVVTIKLEEVPYGLGDTAEDYIYVMRMENGEVVSEPFIPVAPTAKSGQTVDPKTIVLKYTDDISDFKTGDVVLVDY